MPHWPWSSRMPVSEAPTTAHSGDAASQRDATAPAASSADGIRRPQRVHERERDEHR